MTTNCKLLSKAKFGGHKKMRPADKAKRAGEAKHKDDQGLGQRKGPARSHFDEV